MAEEAQVRTLATDTTYQSEVDTVANDVAFGIQPGVPEGWMTFVNVGSPDTIGPGEVYARVRLFYKDTAIATLWSGYVTDDGGVASVPNIRVHRGMSLRVDVWANADAGGRTVRARFVVSPVKSQDGAYLHRQASGTGPPALRTIDLGDPAAGNQYATQEVPAHERWRVTSIRASLAANSTAADRYFRIIYQDPDGIDIARAIAAAVQTASTTIAYTGAVGLHPVSLSADQTFPLPSMLLGPTAELDFSTQLMQSGDNWSDGEMTVESWVVPS